MPLSKVEAFVFGGNCGHFVTSFDFANGVVTVTLKPIESDRPDGAASVIAVFAQAENLEFWEDVDAAWEYPLDIIGFDSYPLGDRWKFVLNCQTVEWIWEADWPSLFSASEL
jgi:hypothetical protein